VRVLKVLITVDTEVWPVSPGWPHTPLPIDQHCERELSCYFYGGDSKQGNGLQFITSVLQRFGLKATFFVDPLFSFALGANTLRRIVALINEHRHEIGLHLHPEWLTDPRCRGLPSFRGPLLWQYPVADQARLLRAGLGRLQELGASELKAFRAGSWGADITTLKALADLGILFDSSLDRCFPESFPSLGTRDQIVQPFLIQGIWEFPVTWFVDWPPARPRPLHVNACSMSEFQLALEQAHAASWFAVIIVLHSFEFTRVDRLESGRPVTPQRLLARRFEALCEYLAANRDRYETIGFAELEPERIPVNVPPTPIASSRNRTMRRYAEQLASRLY
jgi:hypothetical protein